MRFSLDLERGLQPAYGGAGLMGRADGKKQGKHRAGRTSKSRRPTLSHRPAISPAQPNARSPYYLRILVYVVIHDSKHTKKTGRVGRASARGGPGQRHPHHLRPLLFGTPPTVPYRGTSLTRKIHPPWNHHRSLGIGLLKGPTGRMFLVSEVPLYAPRATNLLLELSAGV